MSVATAVPDPIPAVAAPVGAESEEGDPPALEEAPLPRYVKGTFYLLERHDLILEETRVGLRRKGNRRIDKSALVREAIELLAKKYRTSV